MAARWRSWPWRKIALIAVRLGFGALVLFLFWLALEGCAALSAGDYCHRAIDAADLIINVGHDVIA